MNSTFKTPKQQEMFEALIMPMTAVVQMAIGLIMLVTIGPLGQSAEMQGIEIFALEIIAMSVAVYFAVPTIGSKIVDYMILRNHKKAAE